MINIKSNLKNKNEFLNLTPLIDIVFLLLIFFMVTTNFIETDGVDIKLPEANARAVLDTENITIYVTNEDKIYFKGKFLTLSELKDKLKEDIALSPNKIVILKSDKNAKVDIAVKILDIAKSLGADKLVIATKRDDK